jgi:integrase
MAAGTDSGAALKGRLSRYLPEACSEGAPSCWSRSTWRAPPTSAMARLLGLAGNGAVAALLAILYVLNVFAESVQTVLARYTAHEPDPGRLHDLRRRGLRKGGWEVTVPKVRRDRWLTDSEIETVLLILSSLCRPGEAAGIKAEDVITLNGERIWKVAEPKKGKDFLIPLEGPVQEVIELRIAEVDGTGPLF